MRHRRTPKVPKPPKMLGLIRPKVRDLRHLYRGLLQVKAADRVTTLQTALHWFDDAVKYVIFKQQGQLTLEQAQAYEKANKMREVKGRPTEERELFFKKAIAFYEKMLKDTTLEPASLEHYYNKLEVIQPKLENKQEKLEEKFGKMLFTLQKALHPQDQKGREITLRVGELKSTSDSYQMDPEISMLTFRRDYAKEIKHKMYREGLLTAVLEVIKPLSRMMALEEEKDGMGQSTGRLLLSPKKQVQAYDQMLENVVAFAKTDDAPKKLVKRQLTFVAETTAPVNGAQPQPKVKRTISFKHGKVIAGAFREGTLIAELYKAIEDEQWHHWKDLQKLSSRLRRAHELDQIARIGKQQKTWTIETKDNDVRLVKQQGATI